MTWFRGDLVVLGYWLGSKILRVFSYLNDSVILSYDIKTAFLIEAKTFEQTYLKVTRSAKLPSTNLMRALERLSWRETRSESKIH